MPTNYFDEVAQRLVDMGLPVMAMMWMHMRRTRDLWAEQARYDREFEGIVSGYDE